MQWDCMSLTPLKHVNMIKEASPNIQNSILLFFYIPKITRKFIICSIKIKSELVKSFIRTYEWGNKQTLTWKNNELPVITTQETKLRWHQSHILHR